MKKLFFILCASLLITMTHCKKNVEVINSDIVENHTVTIKVRCGSKADVNPINGAVAFVDGDELIVANTGMYIGKLIYDNGVFSGSIENPSEDDYLHFYYLGNLDVSSLKPRQSIRCTVYISDQTTHLPVISYGHSTAMYSEDVRSYSVKLSNKCALVKFNVNTSSEYAGTCLTGMNNQVNISFFKRDADDAITFSKQRTGNITIAPGAGEKWAILLPQDALPAGDDGSVFSGRYSGTRAPLPEIKADDYLTDGIAVNIDKPFVPTGTIGGLFSINSEGKKVYFAKSYFNYNWVTKESFFYYGKQYMLNWRSDYNVGVDHGAIALVTHFGWAASAYDHGAVNYFPGKTTFDATKYYAYGDPSCNLYDNNGRADWGYNYLSNGADAYKQYRTPTKEEWEYLFTGRDDAANKYGLATVNDMYPGIVLLPDVWDEPYDANFTPGIENGYQTNVYTSNQWNSMENAGAIFLTCAGRRYDNVIQHLTEYGLYWSSTRYDDDSAYAVYFDEQGINLEHTELRCYGSQVRLVCE